MGGLILKTIALTCLILLNLIFGLNAQTVTLVSYDCQTRQIEIIPSPPIYSTADFDYTGWSLGQSDGFAYLNTNQPLNHEPNSGFTDIVPAQTIFNVTDYPVRTAVKLSYYKGDTIHHSGSGIMVSPNFVLACSHCVFMKFAESEEKSFADSVLIEPAYDNNSPQPKFGSCISSKYYIPKTWYDGTSWDDVLLIQTKTPIGFRTGWIGLAYANNGSYFTGKVFHKFSYPAYPDPYNPARIYKGDTLYYNYGTLDMISYMVWGLGYAVRPISGQSGSSLIFTDNNVYYTFGILSIGMEIGSRIYSFHNRINKNMFYAFKNIIDSNPTSIESFRISKPSEFVLRQNFPNPVSLSTTFQFYLPRAEHIILKIYNLAGLEIETVVNGTKEAGDYKLNWVNRGLPDGIYYYRLQVGNYSETKKLTVQK